MAVTEAVQEADKDATSTFEIMKAAVAVGDVLKALHREHKPRSYPKVSTSMTTVSTTTTTAASMDQVYPHPHHHPKDRD